MDDKFKILANVALLQASQINSISESLTALNGMLSAPDQTVSSRLDELRALATKVQNSISQIADEQ